MTAVVLRRCAGMLTGAGIGAWAGTTQAGTLGIPSATAAVTGMALGLIFAGTLLVWRLLVTPLGAWTGAAATTLGAAVTVAALTAAVPHCPGRPALLADTGRCTVREVAVWALLAGALTVATLSIAAVAGGAWRLPRRLRRWRRLWAARRSPGSADTPAGAPVDRAAGTPRRRHRAGTRRGRATR